MILSLNINNPLGLFNSPNFMNIFPIVVFVFFRWKWVNGELSKLPVEVISSKPRLKVVKLETNDIKLHFERRELINVSCNIPSLVFVVLVMVWIRVASQHEWTVVLEFNKFHEGFPEFILFIGLGVILFINTIYTSSISGGLSNTKNIFFGHKLFLVKTTITI